MGKDLITEKNENKCEGEEEGSAIGEERGTDIPKQIQNTLSILSRTNLYNGD